MTRPSPAPHDTLDLHTASRDALSFALLAAREELRDLRAEVQVLKARLYIRERYARENTTLAQYAEVERESYREGERVAHALMHGEPLHPGAAGLFPREEGAMSLLACLDCDGTGCAGATFTFQTDYGPTTCGHGPRGGDFALPDTGQCEGACGCQVCDACIDTHAKCAVCDGTGEVEHEECACERCCGAMAGWTPEGVES